ncbi:MAG: leucine-rich repeat domain-containing protein, partial [Christensenellaceae bacterium]|nr:leucine-rich repeat domain-containing protein [Christensenellaceae bacterium]
IESWLKINFSNSVANPMCFSEEILLNGEPIKELVISDTITKIPAYAFYNWKKLEKVTIPDNVTSIGGDAFFGCSGLTNISIPDTVKEIGYGAFSNCEGLKKADLGEGIAAVSDDLFSDCSGLEEVVLNDNITEFGGGAFDECSSLKEITIPSALRKIGRDAFSGCSSLSAVHISDLKNWCEIVFYEEDYITASVYESNPLSLARNLYLNGELLTELTIPEGIEKINNFAFSGCKSIKKLVVPDSVKEIVRTAFWGCTNLEEIIIGDGITEIPFESFKNLKKLKKVTLGENITKISSNAFWSCSALESINIPDSVEKIESYAFAACGSLKEVHITDLDRWCRIKFDDLNIFLSSTPSTNPLFNGAVLYLNGAPVTEVVFPDDISEINMAAFYRCMSLEKVVIPENITKIGSHAFFRCENLKEIIFEGNVPETVEHESFYDLSVKAYYPCDNDQWTEEARNQVGEQLEWIPAHDYESHEWYTETEPTCKEDGEERRDCSICGGYESRTVPKFGHDYEGREWVTETEPSCSADGRATLQCNNCSEYLEKTLPAKGHTIVFDEAVEPTYTSTGLTMGQHCSVCGDVLYPQEIVPMLKVSTPTNVKAVSAGYNAVKLTWNKVPEATGYGIYRYDAAKKTYVYYKPTLEL